MCSHCVQILHTGSSQAYNLVCTQNDKNVMYKVGTPGIIAKTFEPNFFELRFGPI